jgi:hypothetical protein
MKKILFIVLSFTVNSILFSQNKAFMCNGDTINDIVVSKNLVYYFSSNNESDMIEIPKKKIHYYVLGNDTTYLNIFVKSKINYYVLGNDTTYQGEFVDKNIILNEVMLKTDPINYNKRIGYQQIEKAGVSLVAGVSISVVSSIVSSLLINKENYKAASFVMIGGNVFSLFFIVKSGKHLIKSGKLLSENRKETYYYNKMKL